MTEPMPVVYTIGHGRTKSETCPTCRGTGKVEKCATCDDTGFVTGIEDDGKYESETASSCYWSRVCPDCQGGKKGRPR